MKGKHTDNGKHIETYVWQKMTAWFWFSGLPSPRMTPLSVSRLIGRRTLQAHAARQQPLSNMG
jgi:hypothetical protein